MSKVKNAVSAAEAKATLAALAKIEQDTNVSLRMPVWLNLMISGAYGMMIFSWASTSHENLWMLGLIISALVFSLAVGFHLYNSRRLGIKPKVLPKSKAEFIFGLLTALIFATVVILTRLFNDMGIDWAPYTGGAMAAIALAFSIHRYPTGEFKKSVKPYE